MLFRVLILSACASTSVEAEGSEQTGAPVATTSIAHGEASVPATSLPRPGEDEAAPFDPAIDALYETVFESVPARVDLFGISMRKPHMAAFEQQLSGPAVPTKESTQAYVEALGNGATDEPPGSRLFTGLWTRDVDEIDEWDAAFGFTVNNVVVELEFFTDEGQVWVGILNVSEEQIIEALSSDDFWSPHLEETDHAGLSYFRWETDRRQNIDGAGQPRPRGIGGQLALTDDLVIRTVEEQAMHDVLSTLAGDQIALIDGPVVRRAIQRVDSLGLTTVAIEWPLPLEAILRLDDSLDVEDVVEERPLLSPYSAAVAGHNLTTDAVLLLHKDASWRKKTKWRSQESYPRLSHGTTSLRSPQSAPMNDSLRQCSTEKTRSLSQACSRSIRCTGKDLSNNAQLRSRKN